MKNINTTLLKKSALFTGISEKDIESILPCLDAEFKSFKRGQIIFMEGDEINKLGIVISGKLHITKDDYLGNRNIISTVTPVQIFGEAFVCARVKTIPSGVEAAEDSIILMINTSKIYSPCASVCSSHRMLIKNLLFILSEKNIMLNRKIEILSKRTTREKLMAYLLDEAAKAGSSEFTIPYNRQQLADFLSVERSAMSAEISKLRSQGKIEANKSYFRIIE